VSELLETGYAGDVNVEAVFEALRLDPKACLVDVRTRAEWTFVGAPDLTGIGKEPVFAEWQSLPPAPPVMGFSETLSRVLAEQGLDQDSPIYFLCRSGARSRSAAIALTEAGYRRCFNVIGGFEGPLDKTGQRGSTGGWKAAGLPWKQT
jgi:rhodanese-related sulfurtransferase